MDEDSSYSLPLTGLGTDPYSRDLTWSISMESEHGTASVEGGIFTYSPNNGYSGVDTVTVALSNKLASHSRTLIITVNPANDAPVVTQVDPAEWETEEDTPATVRIRVTDPDADFADVTVSVSSGDTTVTITVFL